uniref:EGF-like domain-containing protein n=1 Tax=Chromera velia CCMP2878 TaxID=1169474 RepID=A0A0K6SB98_9ALVE|eukprot:Cvel_13370.t2-p1 / transcript=Cvel_13370.t2 / gene=Cvel_13370 / organism=Chromera_velia_CCMP2878 / gene_product=Delta-like protein C, putative / transcript_product=Delta-like protein C, putative / location=Cvel_scaffold909:35462-38810(+) / protein_length=430 / sequence_SO=supercontig / SO=protein_coding / is_pseudo=false
MSIRIGLLSSFALESGHPARSATFQPSASDPDDLPDLVSSDSEIDSNLDSDGKLAGNLKFPLNFDINGKKEATKTNAYDSKEGETKRKDYNGCNDDPCRNGGLCVETGDRWSDYYCSCPFPWYGQFCELTVLRDECDPNPCLNEGVCQNGVLSAICSCPFPFYGTICELEELPPDFCDPNPCQNGGVCQNGAFSAICSCPLPFYGTNCKLEEIPPEFCEPNPCQNGGACQNGAFGATCSCPFPFYGTNCELEEIPPDFCDPNPCQNGGVCQNGAFGAICSCPFFFYGTNCELEDLPPTPPDCPTNMVLLAQSDNDIALGQVRCVGFDPRFTIRIRSQASCVRAFGNGAELLVVDSVDIWHIAGNRMLEVEPGGGGNRGARARTAGLQIAAVQGFENAGWESSRYWAYDLNGDLTPDSRYEWHTVSSESRV